MAAADRLPIDISGLRSRLESLAKSEERSLSQMGKILLREAVAARERGEVSQPALQDQHLARGFLLKFLAGERPSEEETVELAKALEINPNELLSFCNRLFPKTERKN